MPTEGMVAAREVEKKDGTVAPGCGIKTLARRGDRAATCRVWPFADHYNLAREWGVSVCESVLGDGRG
jgi:hypothetical protein